MEAARGGYILKDYEKSELYMHAVWRKETKTPRPPVALIGHHATINRI